MVNPHFYYAVNPRCVLRCLGYPLMLLGASTLVPFFASLFFLEPGLGVFYLLIGILTIAVGWALKHVNSKRKIRFIEVVAVTCILYLIASLLPCLPLMNAGLSFVDAFFEAVSGVTTTGLTMLSKWDGVPRTTFFARAWLQWIGGIGVMIFSVAFLISQGHFTKKVLSLEYQTKDALSGTKVFVKWILAVYILLTLGGIALMLLFGGGLYESVLLILSSVSTGGFSPYQDSIGSLTWLQQVLITFITFCCAFSLPFYYKVFKFNRWITIDNLQIFGLIILVLILAPALGGSFDDWMLAFSSQTTTGFSSSSVSALAEWKKALLSLSMLIGGGVGSTAGGIKILRLYFLFVFLKTFIIRQCSSKNAFYKPNFFGIKVDEKHLTLALALITLYGIIASLSWFSFVCWGYGAIDALFEVSSAIGTVGLSTGITSSNLPLFLKGVLIIDMLLGRVEILPWLIFFYPTTWFGNQLEA